jgi:hypothetical protein
MNSNTKEPERDFGSYEQALALKELGFDERCLIKSEHTKKCIEKEKPGGCQLHNLHCGYPDCTIDKTITPIPLPLKQQVFRWFREKYELIGLIHIGSQEFSFSVNKDGHRITPLKEYLNYNGTYEEAENACIDKLIEIAKQQEDGGTK